MVPLVLWGPRTLPALPHQSGPPPPPPPTDEMRIMQSHIQQCLNKEKSQGSE